MQFLYEGPVRATDLLRARPGLNAKDLISLLFGHFTSAAPSRPGAGTSIMLRVFTPAGLPAVKIGCQ
jgi:hypothetical protein